MKIAIIIARMLLGLTFFIFGLNGFFHFIPAPPMHGPAGTFAGVMASSHYFLFVAAVQVIVGVLLLINRFVPMALALLAPVLANILVFHITMQPKGLPPGIFATILWAFFAWSFRAYFAPLFVQKAMPK